MARRIMVVTTTRADYGLLSPVIRELEADEEFAVELVVTGTHLVPAFGHTVDEIEADGRNIAERVEIFAPGDSPTAVAATIGRAAEAFGHVYARLAPDLVVVLGDRYELLPIVQAAQVALLPVAHLCGGDVTEGAIDDSIRHCVTKLAHLHFVSNEASGRRVRQLGENPEHVFVVGEPGLDNIRELKPSTRDEISSATGYQWRQQNLLVTFHPVTLGRASSVAELEELLVALAAMGNNCGVMFTFPNADLEGSELRARIESFVAERDNMSAVASLGRQLYLSMLAEVDVVVGNSSSGLIEAPALGTPTVNIGTRQRGRPLARTVVQCEPVTAAIAAALRRALVLPDGPAESPYGDGTAAPQIVAILKRFADFSALTQKRFVDL